MHNHIALIDSSSDWKNLLPLTFTRPIGQIRVGILTIEEKWMKYLKTSSIALSASESYLHAKFPAPALGQETLSIHASILPNPSLIKAITALQKGETLVSTEGLAVAAKGIALDSAPASAIVYKGELSQIAFPWDVFKLNRQEIIADFELLTAGRSSQPISDPFTKVYAPESVFIEEGATVRDATLIADAGPIYIGKNAVVNEGAIIKGAFALGEGAHVNMAAKIKGDTTIGPYCKVGGEVSNSVFFAYSNKGHDGFVGNSVIGEWCNLGADTNTSNLKNNYSAVRVHSYAQGGNIDTEEQFCGLIMGDHCKAGINTMFNTGTIAGVCANVFGGDFPPKHIPSFSWGGSQGFEVFKLDKAYEVAERMMGRRHLELTDGDKSILKTIHDGNAISSL